jgi:hypothetical protein
MHSEYFRLAGYHGWPNNFCAHRQENFPAWHRFYLADVERTLIRADIELGNDGSIGKGVLATMDQSVRVCC